jgi:hypothetical protein
MTSPAFVAHRFVKAIDRRDWDSLAALVDDSTTVHFVHDDKRMTGPEWVRFNADYPGRWSFVAEDVVATDVRAVVRARVFNDEATFHVASFLTVTDGRISDLTEVWADGHPAPTEE